MPIKVSSLKHWAENPRTLKKEKKDKLIKSLLFFPKMMEKRGLMIVKDSTTLTTIVRVGNSRLKCIRAIIKMPQTEFEQIFAEAPNDQRHALALDTWLTIRESKSIPDNWITDISDLSEKELDELSIKDNDHSGQWNWDKLLNFEDFGIDIPGVHFGDELEKEEKPKSTEKTTLSFSLTHDQLMWLKDTILEQVGLSALTIKEKDYFRKKMSKLDESNEA